VLANQNDNNNNFPIVPPVVTSPASR
jgi:hypothetical protein